MQRFLCHLKISGDHVKYYWLIAKWNYNLSGQIILFCLQLVMTMLMAMIIVLFLLSKTETKNKKINNYQSFSAKDLKDQWNEYKTKSENKYTTNENRYFLESNFCEVNILFALVYSYQDVNSKRFKTQRYH